jgi:hypothetical protein
MQVVLDDHTASHPGTAVIAFRRQSRQKQQRYDSAAYGKRYARINTVTGKQRVGGGRSF